MKIPLNMGQTNTYTSKATQTKILERDILAAKQGDWNAKANLVKAFLPLITSLAEKRSGDRSEIGKLIENGKEGLATAARKFNPKEGADRFHIFALDFIEAGMDKKAGGGFFSRLFGRG
jgi:DNA-directed RNA polymerase sigma subunit (sigma70/sigma32)